MRTISKIVLGLIALTAVVVVTVGQQAPASKQPSAEDAQANERYSTALAFQGYVAKGLREPESVKWDRVGVSPDASVACGIYRARNGFGGMAQEQAVWTKADKALRRGSSAQWTKWCANGESMIDQTALVTP